jgi:hypothetical protein
LLGEHAGWKLAAADGGDEPKHELWALVERRHVTTEPLVEHIVRQLQRTALRDGTLAAKAELPKFAAVHGHDIEVLPVAEHEWPPEAPEGGHPGKDLLVPAVEKDICTPRVGGGGTARSNPALERRQQRCICHYIVAQQPPCNTHIHAHLELERGA